MAARPLSEVYSGSLSRNWTKLFKALDAGEKRVTIYRLSAKHPKIQMIHVSCRREKDHYDLCNTVFIDFTQQEMVDWLEKECIGFFPANESEL